MSGIYELHNWERHPIYGSTEVRRDGGDRVILSLSPEGCEGSQCWAWQVETASRLPYKYGVNIGSDLDKETARKQADAAVVAYGYELPRQPEVLPPAPGIALTIVGLTVADAARITQEAGVIFRIGSDNGRERDLGEEIRWRDRVTVSVVDGTVVEALPG